MDLFNGPTKTYESNIAYTLRFMIDTKVIFDIIAIFVCYSIFLGRWNELDRGTCGWLCTAPGRKETLRLSD